MTALACPRLGAVENKKVPIAVPSNTSPRTRAGLKVEEVAHEAPSHLGCWIGCWGESGADAIQRRTTPRRSCAPKGCFTKKFQLAKYPVLCISPQLGLFFLPGSAPTTGPGSRVSLVCTPRASSPESSTHAVTSVVAYEWNQSGQSVSRVGRQSAVSRSSLSQPNHLSMPCHAMLLESAVSLSIAPY